ncbi:MAG: hypothetical protein JWQ01_2673 [Massilia sp.]|nr:hypothetical protein [Massilia sp.]
MDNALESPVGTMNIMDESGHRQMNWSMSNAKEIAAAQKTFDRLVKQGYAAFGAPDNAAPKQTMTAFDPTMEEVVMVPRIVGG